MESNRLKSNLGLLKNLGFLLMLSVGVLSCEPVFKNNKEVTEKTEQLSNDVQQQKDDLLIGISKAICFFKSSNK